MVYALNDKIKIERPIVFLCGPYYKSGDVSDRRRILNKVLLDEYKCLPLIIDNFLTPDNIGDDTISIQLLEEIFAGISFKYLIYILNVSLYDSIVREVTPRCCINRSKKKFCIKVCIDVTLFLL